MSCQPSQSKSATQIPGPNSSRLMEMPLLPLKCTNLTPADAVTFINSIEADCGPCAWKLGIQSRPKSTDSRKNARNRSWASRQQRRHQSIADQIAVGT